MVGLGRRKDHGEYSSYSIWLHRTAKRMNIEKIDVVRSFGKQRFQALPMGVAKQDTKFIDYVE